MSSQTSAKHRAAKKVDAGDNRISQAGALKQRAEKLRQTEISFIASKEFSNPDSIAVDCPLIEQVEAGSDAAVAAGAAGLPPHLRRMCSTPLLTSEEEQALFFRMNYCKYHAASIRATINPSRPSKKKVAEAEEMLERAERLRNYLLQANTRLVMSIARKFADAKNSFDDLLSHGISSLIRAVEKFDCGRGYRFSTYATCAVRRDLYRMVMGRQKDSKRFASASGEMLDGISEVEHEHPGRAVERWQRLAKVLSGMMENLDDREQAIIKARFGFEDEGKKTSYSYLGKRMGISKERVRQLANRALDKLRDHEDMKCLAAYCS